MKQRFTTDELVHALFLAVEAESVRKVAATLGFDPAYVWRVATGKKPLSDDLALALGYEPRQKEYVRTAKEKQR